MSFFVAFIRSQSDLHIIPFLSNVPYDGRTHTADSRRGGEIIRIIGLFDEKKKKKKLRERREERRRNNNNKTTDVVVPV